MPTTWYNYQSIMISKMMKTIILPKNHILYESANDVADICTPLQKHLQVSHFSFVRIYNNGQRAHLSMNAKLQEFFYKKFYTYIERDNLINSTQELNNGYIQWDDMFSYELSNDIKECFNTANGLVLVNKQADYAELAFIGSKAADTAATERYLAHLDLLEQFLSHFKQRAKNLLATAEKQRILTPETQIKNTFPIIHPRLSTTQRQNFLQALYSDKVHLTLREQECLLYLAEGLSIKKIAQQCNNISPRTVARHIENMKHKFDCSKTTQLLNKARELGLLY